VIPERSTQPEDSNVLIEKDLLCHHYFVYVYALLPHNVDDAVIYSLMLLFFIFLNMLCVSSMMPDHLVFVWTGCELPRRKGSAGPDLPDGG
jgi:hypothetical protein